MSIDAQNKIVSKLLDDRLTTNKVSTFAKNYPLKTWDGVSELLINEIMNAVAIEFSKDPAIQAQCSHENTNAAQIAQMHSSKVTDRVQKAIAYTQKSAPASSGASAANALISMIPFINQKW